MNPVMQKISDWLTPIAGKFAKNKFLKIISMAFQITLPIIIVGAIFSLLSSLQIPAYQTFIKSTGLWTLFNGINQFTINAMSIYVAFGAGYAYLHVNKITSGELSAGLFSILCFFTMIPLSTFNVKKTPTSFIGFDYLGAKGLFTALLVGLIVGVTYAFVVKKNWTIKMPNGVPPMVADGFNALIPGFVISFVFIIIGLIFNMTVHETFSEWFYGLLAAPLASLSGSISTWMLLNLFASLCWFFGIHGGQITMPISMLLFMQAGVQNQANYSAGKPMTNILTTGLLFFLMLGGIGNTIGLSIDMFFFSKSKRFKALGKLSILPSIFNINEPIMFGMPIILNPIMAIPFFLAPQITFLITYFVMKLGWISLPRIAMGATGTPLIIDGFLVCGIGGVILEIILIALTTILYLPFFKVQDNMAYKEETSEK